MPGRDNGIPRSALADLSSLSRVQGTACRHVSLYYKTTICIRLPQIQCHAVIYISANFPPSAIPTRTFAMSKHCMANLRSVSGNSLSTRSNHVFRKVSHSPRDFFNLIGLARPPKEADLSSTLEDAHVTKLILRATRDNLRTHALFPEVTANGWHL